MNLLPLCPTVCPVGFILKMIAHPFLQSLYLNEPGSLHFKNNVSVSVSVCSFVFNPLLSAQSYSGRDANVG